MWDAIKALAVIFLVIIVLGAACGPNGGLPAAGPERYREPDLPTTTVTSPREEEPSRPQIEGGGGGGIVGELLPGAAKELLPGAAKALMP